jgi:hypothetical protein
MAERTGGPRNESLNYDLGEKEGDQRTASGRHGKLRVETGHRAGRRRRLLKNGRPVYPTVTAREWASCVVCRGGHEPLHECQRCLNMWHHECSSLKEGHMPGPLDDWFCPACNEKGKRVIAQQEKVRVRDQAAGCAGLGGHGKRDSGTKDRRLGVGRCLCKAVRRPVNGRGICGDVARGGFCRGSQHKKGRSFPGGLTNGKCGQRFGGCWSYSSQYRWSGTGG